MIAPRGIRQTQESTKSKQHPADKSKKSKRSQQDMTLVGKEVVFSLRPRSSWNEGLLHCVFKGILWLKAFLCGKDHLQVKVLLATSCSGLPRPCFRVVGLLDSVSFWDSNK